MNFIFLFLFFIAIHAFAGISASSSSSKSSRLKTVTPDKKIGFKILQIENGSIFEQLGFKIGDVIKKVNGVSVDSLPAFNVILNNAKPGDKVDVLIERNNRKETIHYNLK